MTSLLFTLFLIKNTACTFRVPLGTQCRDMEACNFQILTRFTQPHCLCSRLSTEIRQNLDSNSATTLGPWAQVNYTNQNHLVQSLLLLFHCQKVELLYSHSLSFSGNSVFSIETQVPQDSSSPRLLMYELHGSQCFCTNPMQKNNIFLLLDHFHFE